MKSLDEVSALEVMEKNPQTVDADAKIGEVKAFMDEHDIRAVAVERGDEFVGAIGYREMIRHAQFNTNIELEKVIHGPPRFDPDDSLVDLADLRLNSGRKLLVYVEDNRLKGVVGDEQFLEAASRIQDFENLSTEELAPSELVTAFEQDSIAKARHLMMDENISRIPVLDEEGKMTGLVDSTDLLKTQVEAESMDPGGTSGNSLEDTQIAGGGEKESLSDIPVSEIMDRNYPRTQGYVTAEKAVQEMQQEQTNNLMLMDNEYPETIITVKDLVDYMEEQAQRNMVLVNLVGLDVAEEKASVHDKVRKQLQGSLGRKLNHPEEVRLHFAKSEKDGNRHRFEVTAKIFEDGEMHNVEKEDWNLLDAVDKALEGLDRQLRD